MTQLAFDRVSKRYQHRPALFNVFGTERKGETKALSDISLSVCAGEFVVLLGPNGSGKTTLLKLGCGLLLPDSGTVTIGGKASHFQSQARDKTSFLGMADRSFLGQLTAQENLQFFGAFENLSTHYLNDEIPRLLQRVGLHDAADVRVSRLSSGNLQRLALARGLMTRPDLLLLDEPSRSLDPEAVENFWRLLQELQREGATIVMSTHNIDEAFALADRVIALDAGRICFEQPIRALANSSDLRRLYAEHVRHSA
jgi:ABC-2 type transport system ATP-binding protein